jgi:hypothetical protein
MRSRSLCGAVALVAALVMSGASTGAAATTVPAIGAVNVKFDVGGVLPTFPCPTGCTATVSGTGTGSGTVSTTFNGQPALAAFTVYPSGAVSSAGGAFYVEPGQPFCPAAGFAGGSLTVTGGANGFILVGSQTPGVINNATTNLTFNYVRVGATPVIRITGGSVTLSYTLPDTGSGSLTLPMTNVDGVGGGGAGVLQLGDPNASPEQKAGDLLVWCTGSPGTNVPYSFTGNSTYAVGSVAW